MAPKVCRICLDSNITRTEDLDDSIEIFHDELCDFDVFQNRLLTICPICEYLLKKFYNFKLKCQRTHKLLRNWNKKKVGLENLLAHIPPSSLGFSPRNPTVIEIKSWDLKAKLESSSLYLSEQDHNSLIPDEPIKDEFSDSQFEEPGSQEIILNDLYTEDNGIDDDSQIKEVDQDIKSNDSLNDTENIAAKFEVKNENIFGSETAQSNNDISSEEKDDNCLMEMENMELTTSGSDIDCYTLSNKVEKLKKRVIELMEQGEFKDLGLNMTFDKDMFVHMFNNCNQEWMSKAKVIPGKRGPSEILKIKKLLKHLFSRYHPKYESVFDIEYLNSRPKKLAEFESRRHGQAYLNAKFKCNICYKTFVIESQLKYHNKWHEPGQPQECDICHMRFLSRKMLNAHFRNNHCAMYRCKQCPVVTYNVGVMVNHFDHHKGVEYSCPVCQAIFRSKSAMYTHRLLRHKTCHICPLCARSFVSDRGLVNHMKFKHRDESVTATVSCEQCSAKLATQEILQKHIIEHHKRKNQHMCGRCKLIFKSAEELQQHLVSPGHAGCARSGARRHHQGDREARDNVHGPDKPTRTCPVCLVEVANDYHVSLYMHYKTEHPEEPYRENKPRHEYLCEVCGKGYKAPSAYLAHMNTHTGQRPYECGECEARFAGLARLKVHQERHRPRSHKCKDCGKLYITAANLYTHRLTHSTDRRYKCDICFKGFLLKSTLNEHVRGVHHQIRRVKKTPRKVKAKAK